MSKCPHCHEDGINNWATKCPYCGGAIAHGDRSMVWWQHLLISIAAMTIFVYVLIGLIGDGWDFKFACVIGIIGGPIFFIYNRFFQSRKK